MRITNNIMLNTQKGNINANKILMDAINTQMSTQKKISKPSDDPIVAVRSLRLRANYAELTQYTERNIEDGLSWMDVTESAMENMRAIIKEMYANFIQGDVDYIDTAQRGQILENLEASMERFYAEGNSSYAGRTLFTGYKTDSDFLYKTNSKDHYNITETFSASQINTRDYVSGCVDKTNVTVLDPKDFPQTNTVKTFNLTYTGVDSIQSITYYADTDGDGVGEEFTITAPTVYSLNDIDPTDPTTDPYLSVSSATGANINSIVYVKETGELLIGRELADQLTTENISVNYDKEGFQKGDINPVMYFDCRLMKENYDANDPTTYIDYKKERQDIEYNVGFNQKIKVNAEGSDVLLLDVKKEIANLRDAITSLDEAEKKKSDIEAMLADSRYSDKKDELNSMLEAVNKEIDLKNARMVNLFKKGVGSMQAYEDHVSTQITDMGNRYSQLEMIKTRMQQQQTNYKELMTNNENRELSDILLDYTSINYSFNLALQATGSISKLSLLNYI